MNKRRPAADHTLLIFLLAIFLFNSPINLWWSSITLPWYAVFAPWVLIVLLIAWNHSRQEHGD
ncbi:MAG: hypothetical protein AB8B97_12875 [Granulosicoccus sp.]